MSQEHRDKLKQLFQENVSNENALEFVSEMVAFSQDESAVLTSEILADAICDLLFDPLDHDST